MVALRWQHAYLRDAKECSLQSSFVDVLCILEVNLPSAAHSQIARPTLKRPPDSLILENRRKEELCHQVKAEQREAQKLIFKVSWYDFNCISPRCIICSLLMCCCYTIASAVTQPFISWEGRQSQSLSNHVLLHLIVFGKILKYVFSTFACIVKNSAHEKREAYCAP